MEYTVNAIALGYVKSITSFPAPWNSCEVNKSPETAPSNPVLTDILYTRCLREKLVNLVADVELLVRLEVPSCKLFLNSGKHLQSSGVLGLASLVRNSLLSIENASF